MLPHPPRISTCAPGNSARCGTVTSQAAGRLSLTLAASAGATPGGSATSAPSACGTRNRSENMLPHSPPTGSPYIACGVSRQLVGTPRRQRSQDQHDTCQGTATSCPTDKPPPTASPSSTISATHSWPRASGPENG